MGKHKHKQQFKLWEKASRKCQKCGVDVYIKSIPATRKPNEKQEVGEIHHIVSKSVGGSNNINNYQLLCPYCHNKEHGENRYGKGECKYSPYAKIQRKKINAFKKALKSRLRDI